MRRAPTPLCRTLARRAASFLAALLHAVTPRGLWPRLFLLILAATGPLMALLVLSAVADGRRVLDTARDQVVQLAQLAAEQQDDMVQEASGLLRVLARVPEVRLIGRVECDGLLNAVISDHPRINVLAVVGVDGIVACSTNPVSKGLSLADRAYFQEALASRSATAVVMGAMTISRATGKPAVFFAAPLERSPGSDVPPGVILAGLDLEWFAHLSDRTPGLADQLVQVLDSRDGAVLAEAPDAAHRTGQRFPSHPVIEAFKSAPGGGSVQAADLDGVSRIFGFAPLPGRATGLVVAIGLKEADIRAAADQRFWLSIGIAFAATGFALLTAWLIAKLTVLRPIDALVRAAALVGSGDLSARATIGCGAAAELRSLGTAFTRMAGRLQARDGRIAVMQQEIAVSEGHHRLLTENANDMIIRYSPEFRRLYVSPACRDLLGYEPEELVGGHPESLVHPADREAMEEVLDRRLLTGNATARASFRLMRKDGCYVWLETNVRRLEDGSGFMAVTRDVSERKALEAQLEEANRRLRVLAREDALTRLANRRHFDEMLGEEYRRATRVHSPLALVMLDVDRFKSFNDTYGHPGGDACLKALASTITGLARRPADLAARYGGEEFVILLPDTDAAGALAQAERIRVAVRGLAIPHAGSDIGFATVSVGVAVMVPFVSAQGPAALVEAADAALYDAKRAGRNTVRLAEAQVAMRVS